MELLLAGRRGEEGGSCFFRDGRGGKREGVTGEAHDRHRRRPSKSFLARREGGRPAFLARKKGGGGEGNTNPKMKANDGPDCTRRRITSLRKEKGKKRVSAALASRRRKGERARRGCRPP